MGNNKHDWIEIERLCIDIISLEKRGSLVVSALACSARGHGFDPRGRRGNILVSKHAFFSLICRDDTK